VARPRGFDEDLAVEQAMQLFWRRGYEGTSVRDLGDELGLRPGSLYAAFGDKRSLFLRALDRYCAGQGAGLLAAVDGPGPLLPRLRALLVGVAEANRAGVQPPGCLVVSTASELVPGDDDATARVRAAFDRIDAALEVALGEAVRRGELAPDLRPRGVAMFLTTFLQGLTVVSRADPGHDRVDASVDVALAAVTGAAHSDRLPVARPARNGVVTPE
jgi:TetR/AcrR family transcriptional repressor of nem operon